MSQARAYSRVTVQAVALLGKQIKLRRKQRHWSEQELAERAGIARATLQKIESGAMTTAIGLVFELAALLGLKLFDDEGADMSHQLALSDAQIALLPKHIYPEQGPVDDDF